MKYGRYRTDTMPFKSALLLIALAAVSVARVSLAAGFPDVLAQVKPSVVGVALYQPTGRPPARLLGTGFVVGDGKLIATNAHVISEPLDLEKRQSLAVLVGVGEAARMLPARLLRRDDEHDLALLKVEERLPSLSLAADNRAREGETYAFTGFPIGAVLGLYPVTHRGMISSITPIAIPVTNAKRLDARKIRRLQQPVQVYQLDATAYPGNSGSPLYDMADGSVVGVLNQVYVKATKEDVLSQPSGISYAIPVHYLRKLIASQP